MTSIRQSARQGTEAGPELQPSRHFRKPVRWHFKNLGAPGSLVGKRWNMARPTFEPPAAGEGVRMPWSRSERLFPRRILQPLQSFLETEAASGVLLLVAAATALVWANSPWRGSYGGFWGTNP